MPLYVRSINLSLSLEDDPAIVEAVREAGANGIKVVVTTGTSMATPIVTGSAWTGTLRQKDPLRPPCGQDDADMVQ